MLSWLVVKKTKSNISSSRESTAQRKHKTTFTNLNDCERYFRINKYMYMEHYLAKY